MIDLTSDDAWMAAGEARAQTLTDDGGLQEHGIISARDGAILPDLPVGTRLRILPNHACATAAQHDRYHVIRTGSLVVADHWERLHGW